MDKNHLNSRYLGQKIRDARERCGLSQEELAAEMGLGQRAISELENGKRKLSVSEVPQLASILDVPLLFFFAEDDNPNIRDEMLLEQFHQLPSDDLKNMAIDIVRLLVKNLP